MLMSKYVYSFGEAAGRIYIKLLIFLRKWPLKSFPFTLWRHSDFLFPTRKSTVSIIQIKSSTLDSDFIGLAVIPFQSSPFIFFHLFFTLIHHSISPLFFSCQFPHSTSSFGFSIQLLHLIQIHHFVIYHPFAWLLLKRETNWSSWKFKRVDL